MWVVPTQPQTHLKFVNTHPTDIVNIRGRPMEVSKNNLLYEIKYNTKIIIANLISS